MHEPCVGVRRVVRAYPGLTPVQSFAYLLAVKPCRISNLAVRKMQPLAPVADRLKSQHQ